MHQPTILLISRDGSQVSQIHRHFQENGYQVVEASCGGCVPAQLAAIQPTLALLDWDIPDTSPLALIRAIRSQQGFTKMPIILIGREISCENKILSLEAGVDFCLDGALALKELTARVRALIRRAEG